MPGPTTRPTKPPPSAAPVAAPPAEAPLESVLYETSQRQTIVDTAAQKLGVAPKKLCDMLRHVWTVSKGQAPLTDREMYIGLSLIARYDLDPLAKEVYVSRSKDGRVFTMIAVDGWVKVLNKTPHYDGFEVEIGWRDEAEGTVDWVKTTIFSKRHSHPTAYIAFWAEYQTQMGFKGRDMPIHMLRIFSFRHAARLFVPIGGVSTPDEGMFPDPDLRGEDPRPDVVPDLAYRQHEEEETLRGFADAIRACDTLGHLESIRDDVARAVAERRLTPESATKAMALWDRRREQIVRSIGQGPGSAARRPDCVAEYKAAIDSQSFTSDVDKITARWDATDDHNPDDTEEIRAYAEGRKVQIRATRGERSNGGGKDLPGE